MAQTESIEIKNIFESIAKVEENFLTNIGLSKEEFEQETKQAREL